MPVRIGIIGTGGIANAHATRLQEIHGSSVTACCDVVPGKAAEFARRYGISAAYEDARAMIDAGDLDAVTVATPDRYHAEPALLALRSGLHVLCEKPLAFALGDARRMADEAAKRPELVTSVNFSYRNNPATQKAAALVESGRLGRIRHVEGRYLQGWLVTRMGKGWETRHNLLWRLSSRHGSLGVLGDLGVHLFDLARFVVGPFEEIFCDLRVFEKQAPGIGEYVFDANDTAIATVRFRNGASGTLHTTRWATGHANTVGLRVHGEAGALDLDLDRGPEALRVCLGRKALEASSWRTLSCPKTPDMFQRFVSAIRTGRPSQTHFAGGLEIQTCLAKSVESSKKGRFVKV